MTKYIFTVGLLIAFVISASPQSRSNKMNGVSLVATRSLITQNHMQPIANLNANWVTVMPFGFIPNDKAEVKFNEKWQWIGETVEGVKHTIKLAKKNNLKVLLKPHIWLHDGWIGDLKFDNEKNYQIFEKSYSEYILTYAKLAQILEVEVFSIGVELKQMTIRRPKFWPKLIAEVKKHYKGKLTYAANWDNYQKVKFWKKLDFIGIDAYFPIETSKSPSFQSCFIGWKRDFEAIKSLSDSTERKVVFTEFGYRNIDYTAKEPWTTAQNNTYNSPAQINAYRALFARFWKESWFAGGFLWKWFPNHKESGGSRNNRFTPQNKPVEKVIREFYGKVLQW